MILRGIWSKQRGDATVVIIAPLAAIVLVVVAVVVALYLGGFRHANEETSKYVPGDSLAYFSVNLRPGVDQLKKLRGMIKTYEKSPGFQEKLDELLDDVEEESGIDVNEEIVPWLGPELSIALVKLNGLEDVPEIVTFVGTRDAAATEGILRRSLEQQSDDEGLEFEEGSYKGFPVFSDIEEEAGHVAITESYLVFATSGELLRATIDRMEAPTGSLAKSARFKEAQADVPEERFSFLYVDVKGLLDQAEASGDAEVAEGLETYRDLVPETIAASAAYIERGMRVDVTYPTTEGTVVTEPSAGLGSAAVLPADTFALFSVSGFGEAVTRLTGGVAGIVAGSEWLGQSREELFEEIERETGIDLQEDLFDWMSGEVAVALLASSFVTEPGEDIPLIHAVGLLQFDVLADARAGVETIVGLIEEEGIELEARDIGGKEARVLDLSGTEAAGYTPGYLFVGEYVVVGSTEQALESVVQTGAENEASLEQEAEFLRLMELTPGASDSLVYVNVRGLMDAAVAAFPEEDSEEYRSDVLPFVGPLRAFLLTRRSDEERTSVTMIITID